MSKYDYCNPNFGLSETFHDLEVEKLERLYRETWLCSVCGRRNSVTLNACEHHSENPSKD